VLEIGTGCGYAAAVLGHIAAEVHSIERLEALARLAQDRLAWLGLAHVQVHCADGTLGWPAAAPYDAIVVTAAGPAIPAALVDQLMPGGVIVMPVGARDGPQQLLRWRRGGAGRTRTEALCDVRFVPLLGAQGFAP
jgi:protein-L-isoaspartate(D-aspartate) O-methyltransferase